MYTVYELRVELALPHVRTLNRIGARVVEWEPFPDAFTEIYILKEANATRIYELLQELAVVSGTRIRKRVATKLPFAMST